MYGQSLAGNFGIKNMFFLQVRWRSSSICVKGTQAVRSEAGWWLVVLRLGLSGFYRNSFYKVEPQKLVIKWGPEITPISRVNYFTLVRHLFERPFIGVGYFTPFITGFWGPTF